VGAAFLAKLANDSGNDSIFALDSIKALIQLQWKFFKPRIIKKLFVPFLVYHVIFLVYITYVREK
jgi:hypothetical protein